ncbi:MAG: hypothetical protein JW742_00425 [Candidatus Aminicenantes bacterium]|nr:hypothetical protein [Candidatus Aminicenantes bacterium]
MSVAALPVFIAFLAILLAVNLAVRRRAGTARDFFFAPGGLGAPLVALSLSAAWFGATSILVSMDEACRRGVGAFWIIGMPAVLTLLAMLPLAGRAARLTSMTLPEMAESRYGPTVRRLVAFLIYWYMVVFAASQLVALGRFLQAFLDAPYLLCLGAAALTVLAYAVLGGFFSVVLAESLQFAVLLAGMSGLAVFLLGRTGFAAVADEAGRLNIAGYFDFLADGRRSVLTCLSFLLAWIVSPVAWQRIRSARSARAARRGILASVPIFLILYGLVVAAGMLSLPLTGAPSGETPLVSELIASRTGPYLGALLFAAVLAAVISTLDAGVNTGALTMVRDLVPAAAGGGRSGVARSRLATALTMALAFLAASRFTSILGTLGLASEIMAEGLFLPGAAMFVLKRKLPTAGLLSLSLGGGFALAGFLSRAGGLPLALPEWPFSLPAGLGLSAAGFGLGAAWDLGGRAFVLRRKDAG